MIKHIVFFKLTDRSPLNIKRAKDVLEDMEGKIPQLKYIEVGIDLLHSARSYDIALITKFDSVQDLEAYQIHPVHVEVSKFMASIREAIVVVDFEV